MDRHRPIPRALSVTPEPGFILSVTCHDGTLLHVDLTGWIEQGPSPSPFDRLRDAVIFSGAAVSQYGWAIEWEGDEDLAIDMAHLELLADQQRAINVSTAPRSR